MPGKNKCANCNEENGWYLWSRTTDTLCVICAKQRRDAIVRDQDKAREMVERTAEIEADVKKTQAQEKAITEREKEKTKQLYAEVNKEKEETKRAEAAANLKIAMEETKQKKAEEAVMDKRIRLEQERRKCIQAEESRDRVQAEKLAHCSKIVATLSNMGTSEIFVRQLLRQMLGGNDDKEENEQNQSTTPYQPKRNRTLSVKM